MKIGYIRVSTQEQNTGRQETILRELGAERLYIEKASGAQKDKREKLTEMLKFVREGDTVIVESISRFARNTRHLLELLDKLSGKGAGFISAKESIDTGTPTGRFMLTVFGAVAELERGYLLERQREGIAEAKKGGKYKGRKPISIDPQKFEVIRRAWMAGEITAVAAYKKLGVSSSTFYRRMRE
jgi:DNA invertase Pin-like site-specific DNA recombinase